ncbi:hypothetical protein A2U01_0040359, partial [Trifolium medium]|nr:hypothetical protein [Trifolium medium]
KGLTSVSAYQSALDRTLGFAFTLVGSDVEISSPFSKSARHSGLDFSTVYPVLGPGVDSREERARSYLCLVCYAWLLQVVFPDPPRPCEQEALIQEEAQSEGPLATSLTNKIKTIRAIANDILLSGELPDGSHAQRDVQQIWDLGCYALQYRRRGGGSTQ